MAARFLLDTVILIDVLNGSDSAARWLNEVTPGGAVISVVTRCEVLVGVNPTKQDELLGMLEDWKCLSVTPEIADLAAALRREYRWKLPDAFQAALSQHHGLLLATRNTKDFPPETHAFVRIPYRVP